MGLCGMSMWWQEWCREREFEEHSNGKGAYVKPVLRFMPASMVETDRRVSECLGSGEE